MGYIRVLPRDAFNEANLLKCIGQLTLMIEERMLPNWTYAHSAPGSPFNIQQDESSGSLFILGLNFFYKGVWCNLIRPLNSREPWPLYAHIDDVDHPIFDDNGNVILK